MPDTVPEPQPSATLILVRDAPAGMEVLMLRRSPGAGFVAGAHVFPGGVIGPEDEASQVAAVCHPCGGDAQDIAHRACAIRESFEEAGLLLARDVDGEYPALDRSPLREQIFDWRCRLHAGAASPAQMCRELGLRLDLAALAPFAHWITPRGSPRRFDTRFYVAVAPARQPATADGSETIEQHWITPAAALEKFSRDTFALVHVTASTLKALARFDSAQALMDHARTARDVPAQLARIASDASGRCVIEPDHPAYAEVGRRDPDGHRAISCELAPGRLAQISPRLARVTAPNGSFMTGPGTNTYLLGEGRELALIDPGPDDPRHIAAVLAAVRDRQLRWILLTHTHLDHSPAAAPIRRATGAELIGMPPPEHGPQDRSFVPDQVPAHGDQLHLAGMPLRVLHTPGHASNHLCYLLTDERLLFTGDHIMQGSTVVIPPPDGDMASYLASLGMLLAEPLDWLAPGHGFLMDAPHARIERLLAHRRTREHKTLAALHRLGAVKLDALVAAVYDDVPTRAHPVAARSLLATLLKLEAESRALQAGGLWRATD